MVTKKTKKYFNLFNLFLIGVFLLTAGFGCKNPGQEVQEYLKPVTLEYWRIFDEEDAFEEIIAAYHQSHPNININYRKFRYEEFEEKLLDALAENRGPDILSINSLWVREYQNKLAPMPENITMAYQKVKGTIKKEVSVDLRTYPTPTTKKIKELFPDIVYKNVSLNEKVYGLPLSLETLVIFYNKDLLNRSGVSQPPASWDDFQSAVQKITRFDSNGNIRQSGTALGTAYNIERNFDILSVLIMQNGATMIDAKGNLRIFDNQADDFNPGIEAINFYLDFANPVKNVYSWNEDMTGSINAFLTGEVGMVFGYNYHLPTIRANAPRLNFGVAPIPQVNNEIPQNYANYWIESVSAQSPHINEAWDFILFATTQAEQAKKFLTQTQRPTALRSLINSQMEDEDLSAATSQTLTGNNWYAGNDSSATEEAFRSMIEQLPDAVKESELRNIFFTTTKRVFQTYY